MFAEKTILNMKYAQKIKASPSSMFLTQATTVLSIKTNSFSKSYRDSPMEKKLADKVRDFINYL